MTNHYERWKHQMGATLIALLEYEGIDHRVAGALEVYDSYDQLMQQGDERATRLLNAAARGVGYSLLPICSMRVSQALDAEMQHQREKYGESRQQSLPGFILVAEAELAEAKLGWCKNSEGRSSPLHELVQTAAVILTCLEQYGVSGSAVSTNDISVNS